MKFKAAPFDARRLQGTTLHNKGYLVEYIAKANAAERDSKRANARTGASEVRDV